MIILYLRVKKNGTTKSQMYLFPVSFGRKICVLLSRKGIHKIK